MDNYNNPSPITPSIFDHSNPLKETLEEFKEERVEETREYNGGEEKQAKLAGKLMVNQSF